MPHYIPPTKSETEEIFSIIERISDKEKRFASLREVASSTKAGFKSGQKVINKLIKEGLIRSEFVNNVEHLHRVYNKKNR